MIAAIGLGEILWTLLVVYLIISVLIGTVVVVLDVVRADDVSGAGKALWLFALFFFPLITVLVYLFTRGDGIGERNLARSGGRPTAPPAGYAAGPATELQTAKALLDDGTLSAEEFAELKARILR